MNNNRVLIYFFYDEQGIVDDYITYFLNEIKKHVKKIVFVSNGKLQETSKAKLNNLRNIELMILERENKGYDVWAYKEGIESVGWNELSRYDELILANYTIFGPINSFDDMFNAMGLKEVDFWGITKHHEVDFDAFGTCKYGYIPEHIQSSFIVIRNGMIKSREYQQLWNNMPMINSYSDSVGLYEAIFTKDFTDMGFKHDVYVNTEDLRKYTRYPLMMMSDELVINRKCPVIKRKSFSQSYYDILSETIGKATSDMYDYIKKYSKYDVNMIWDNILRTFHMSDIKDIMHLNYILSHDFSYKESSEVKRVALVVHIFFVDKVEYVLKYIKNIPGYIDVFISTDTIEKQQIIERKLKADDFKNFKSILVQNRGRDVSALLVGFKPFLYNYDYVCFAHDKKTSQIKPLCVGEGFSDKCFDNILGSKAYIENIIMLFEDNERLGLLSPPPPNHSAFYQTLYSTWANNYNNTCNLLEKMDIKVPIHWSKDPIAPLGTMFWFRTKALEKLFDKNWVYDDFPSEPNATDGTLLHAIERAYPFFAQSEGFYSAWVLSDKFSRLELNNLHFMLKVATKANLTNNNLSPYANSDMIKNMKNFDILKIKMKPMIHPKIWKCFKKIYFLLTRNKST